MIVNAKEVPDPSNYLMWLGPVLDEPSLQRSPAASPAGNRWQSGLLYGLVHSGQSTSIIGHLPCRMWPRGQMLVPGKAGAIPQGLQGQLISYCNSPWLRQNSLRSAYLRALQSMIRTQGAPRALVTYNASVHHVACGRWAKQRGIPWICIVADPPGDAEKKLKHTAVISEASGRIVLAWGLFQEMLAQPSLHLDGGIVSARFHPDSMSRQAEPVIVYTGALTRWGGADLLIEAFQRVRNPAAELWVCGHCDTDDIRRLTANNPRIKWFGMVSEEKLVEICRSASVFVNPRPPEVLDNQQNFPSKVLEYLSYGRPVVSTWTNGLSPDYRKVLLVAECGTSESMAAAIDAALDMDDSHLRKHSKIVSDFLQHKTWSRQAERLVQWLNQELS